MTQRRRLPRLTIALLWLVPGTTVLGTSCGQEVRDTLIDAGVGFVGDSASTLLEALIPVQTFITPAQAAT